MVDGEQKLMGMREPLVYMGLTGFFLLFVGVLVFIDVMSSKILPVRLHETTVAIGAICVVGALCTFHMATKGMEKRDDALEAQEDVPRAIQEIMAPTGEAHAVKEL